MGQLILNPPPWSKSKAVPAAVHNTFMTHGPGSMTWSPPKMKKLADLVVSMSEGLSKQAWLPAILAAARVAAPAIARAVGTQVAVEAGSRAVMSGAQKLKTPKPPAVEKTAKYATKVLAVHSAIENYNIQQDALNKVAGMAGTTLANMGAKLKMAMGTPARRASTAAAAGSSVMRHGKSLAFGMAVPMALESGIRVLSAPKKQKKQTQNPQQPGQDAGPPTQLY